MHFKLHLAHFVYLTLVLSCNNQQWRTFSVACEKLGENDALIKPQTATLSSPEEVAAPSPVSDDADAQVEILPNYKKIRKYDKQYESVEKKSETQKTPTPRSDATKRMREKETSVLSVTDDGADSAQSEKPKTVPNSFSVVPDAGNYQPDTNNIKFQNIVSDRKVNSLNERLVEAEVPNDVVNNKKNNNQNKNNNKKNRLSDNYLDDNVTTNYKPKTTAEGRRLLKETQNNDGLPEIITEVPRVTLTELPMDFVVVEPQENVHDTLMFNENGKDDAKHAKRANETVDADYDKSNGSAQKDEQILKFNDPGGGGVESFESDYRGESNIPTQTESTVVAGVETPTASEADGLAALRNDSSGIGNKAGDAKVVNLTVEEVPIPVFSEWAQKQMEAEASKMQALEQEQQVVNNSAQRRNNTHVNGKSQTLKMRSKNYASPDCGAKIIASNPDADHTGAVLTQSRDEYMLNPCGERIWFVVELCEAIQAQKIELANFELFSSSPKNFTVAVSNRFPTRDWSNVGHFTAEDKRTVQSFDLHPHLFGKFVRVDIHSHYSKEHFCPVSLFRAFGTSEIEAFETEIGASNDLDDFDDEEEPAQAKRSEDTFFKSASDVVLQMVKKAAKVLVKPATTHALHKPTKLDDCYTPAFGLFSCERCKNNTLVARINAVLSCELQQLQELLAVAQLRAHLQQTRTCIDDFSIVVPLPTLAHMSDSTAFVMHKKQSYFLNILPPEYIGALCKLISELDAHKQSKMHANNSLPETKDTNANSDTASQQTDDFVTHTNDNKTTKSESSVGGSVEQHDEQATHDAAESVQVDCADANTAEAANQSAVASATDEQTGSDLVNTLKSETSGDFDAHVVASGSGPLEGRQATSDPPSDATAPDVNIFNVPAVEPETVVANALPPITPQTTPMQIDKDGDNDVQSKVRIDGDSTTPTSSTATTTTSELIPEIVAPTPQPPAPPQPASSAPASTPAPAPAQNSDEEAGNWEGVDNPLTTTVASITASGSAAAAAAAGVINSNNKLQQQQQQQQQQQKVSNGAQSESVFIRLSNRVKALERNMSLSGQYLEELSRRYKKQVEELQQTLTQQTLTVRTLEEQSRLYAEEKQLFMQQNADLSNEVRSLAFQVQFCFGIVLFVGTCILLLVVLGYIYYRKLRRQTQELMLLNDAGKSKPNVLSQRKLNRRKSFEDFSDHQQGISVVEKQRRPSEEAMLILKECGDVTTTKTVLDESSASATSTMAGAHRTIGSGQVLNKRQRKISVCYGSNNNITGSVRASQAHIAKRKGVKHSWHGMVDRSAIERDNDKYFDTDDTLSSSLNLKSTQTQATLNGASFVKSKKKTEVLQQQQQPQQPQAQALKRQKSAPGQFDKNITVYDDSPHSDFEEQLLLDDEDLDNFIPNSDLAYNEFMPEGPSGYQIVDTSDSQNASKKSNKSDNKKSRRLSSPAFFKTAFGKSKTKPNANIGKPKVHPVHEPTSWEWYRLKCSNDQQQQDKSREQVHTAASNTPTASLDSSSLSEINFPTNSTQNSFRILEEAILSSGESISAGRATKNGSNGKTSAAASSSGNSSSSSGGGGASSNHSTSSTNSSNAKKKNRTFNKIFRNVF